MSFVCRPYFDVQKVIGILSEFQRLNNAVGVHFSARQSRGQDNNSRGPCTPALVSGMYSSV